MGVQHPNVEKVQECVRRAFRVALTERRGRRISSRERSVARADAVGEAMRRRLPATHICILQRRTARSGARAARGRRTPRIRRGRGLISEKATAAMAQLAKATEFRWEHCNIPRAFPSSHALALGPLGRNGFGSAKPHRAQGRSHHCGRRAYRRCSDDAQIWRIQRQCEAWHHSAAPGQMESYSRHAWRDRLDAVS